MVLPVSQSLLVQSVSAVCLDYVPGVSSYVSLYKSVLPHVTCGLLLMSDVSNLYRCPSRCSCISSVCSSLNTLFVTILVSSFLDPRVYRDTSLTSKSSLRTPCDKSQIHDHSSIISWRFRTLPQVSHYQQHMNILCRFLLKFFFFKKFVIKYN